MNVIITAGCILLTSVCAAQQSPPTMASDSLRNLDNMPVVRNLGNPARMPVQKDTGTVADMPTRRTGVPTQPEVPFRKESAVLEEQLKHLRMDSSNQVKPRSGLPRKKNR